MCDATSAAANGNEVNKSLDSQLSRKNPLRHTGALLDRMRDFEVEIKNHENPYDPPLYEGPAGDAFRTIMAGEYMANLGSEWDYKLVVLIVRDDESWAVEPF